MDQVGKLLPQKHCCDAHNPKGSKRLVMTIAEVKRALGAPLLQDFLSQLTYNRQGNVDAPDRVWLSAAAAQPRAWPATWAP